MLAQESAEAHRLLTIYTRRLESNLIHSLCPLLREAVGAEINESAIRASAKRIAQEVGAQIDGLYLRRALRSISLSRTETIALTEGLLDRALRAEQNLLRGFAS